MLQPEAQEFYKYCFVNRPNWKERLENYLNQNIWLTKLSGFNDPFEGQVRVKHANPREVVNNDQLFNGHYETHKNYEPSLTRSETKERWMSPEFNAEFEKQNHGKKLVKDFFTKYGAMCLTRDSSNIPMWAHYTDEHKGYCLVFEFNLRTIPNISILNESQQNSYIQNIMNGDDIVSFSFGAQKEAYFWFTKIRYNYEPPVLDEIKIVNYSGYDQYKYIIQNSIGVKFMQWQYEDEYRLIANCNSDNMGILNLNSFAPFLKIIGVILGYKIRDDDKKTIIELCDKYQKKLYQARCSEEGYKIEISEVLI